MRLGTPMAWFECSIRIPLKLCMPQQRASPNSITASYRTDFSGWPAKLCRGLLHGTSYILHRAGYGAPAVPTNVQATAISPTQVDVGWDVSTDNVGVTGYAVLRDGVEIATTGSPGYTDVTVQPATTYSYTVTVGDAVGAGDDLGAIEVGKLADIVLLDANPLEHIWNTKNTLKIWRVIKGGWGV